MLLNYVLVSKKSVADATVAYSVDSEINARTAILENWKN